MSLPFLSNGAIALLFCHLRFLSPEPSGLESKATRTGVQTALDCTIPSLCAMILEEWMLKFAGC